MSFSSVDGLDPSLTEGESGRVSFNSVNGHLANGEHGELLTRGPHVFQAYWKNPEATSAHEATGERDMGAPGEESGGVF
ncbi:MAG: hypothetical protein ACYDGY_05610 [Acidimicrobiales bacterium]